MKKGGMATTFGSSAVVMVVLLAVEVHQTAAQLYCDPLELSPCVPAIAGSGTNPTPECCTKLREQAPCFCKYLDNPAFQPFRKSPNTKKVIDACAVIPPLCWFSWPSPEKSCRYDQLDIVIKSDIFITCMCSPPQTNLHIFGLNNEIWKLINYKPNY